MAVVALVEVSEIKRWNTYAPRVLSMAAVALVKVSERKKKPDKRNVVDFVSGTLFLTKDAVKPNWMLAPVCSAEWP